MIQSTRQWIPLDAEKALTNQAVLEICEIKITQSPVGKALGASHAELHRKSSGRLRHATGDVIVVRYADDAVLGFQHRADAERFLQDWKERLSRFGLELHPDKTRLIEFGRFAAANRKARGEGTSTIMRFLGIWPVCTVFGCR